MNKNLKPKAIICWSGGKDSSLALYKVLNEGKYDIVALLTTLNENHRRISMHGIREELLDAQAESIGIPCEKVWVKEGTNEEYEQRMGEKMQQFKDQGITHVIFGDIFLEDLRAYRENNLNKIGLKAVFPLWKNDTNKLVKEFLDVGFKTITCCISTKYLDENAVGVNINHEFIQNLPDNVDPCGENGEFHTFCYAGPIFKKDVHIEKGEKVFKSVIELGGEGKDGFWFIDLKLNSYR